ncbi:MAG: hypothetical protein MI742_15830 [Desulfobacterales bacterium]|nr:hypothetical protein [Desulfobacterales bacterium]
MQTISHSSHFGFVGQTTGEHPVASAAFRYLVYSLLLVAMALAITWEACHGPLTGRFMEESLVEMLQIVVLLFTGLLGWVSGKVAPQLRALSTLIMGLATMAVVRELDAVLDRMVFDGAWQTLVLGIAALTKYHISRCRVSLSENVKGFIPTAAFGVMASGSMMVLVVSRLLGRATLWKVIMGDGYMRIVKLAVEEGLELMGYTLILVGVLEMLRQLVSSPFQRSEER